MMTPILALPLTLLRDRQPCRELDGGVELSDGDLDSVVGGLARAWVAPAADPEGEEGPRT
jgi:hypothetical protein